MLIKPDIRNVEVVSCWRSDEIIWACSEWLTVSFLAVTTVRVPLSKLTVLTLQHALYLQWLAYLVSRTVATARGFMLCAETSVLRQVTFTERATNMFSCVGEWLQGFLVRSTCVMEQDCPLKKQHQVPCLHSGNTALGGGGGEGRRQSWLLFDGSKGENIVTCRAAT